MRLQSKILSLLVPLSILPILALGWAAYALLMDDARTRTQHQVTGLLEQIQSQTEAQLRTARANASLFANNALVSHYSRGGLTATEKNLVEPMVRDLLYNYQLAYPEYYEIRIISPDGKEQLRSVLGKSENLTDNESGSNYYQEASNQPNTTYTTFFRNLDNNEPALLTSKPLLFYDEGSRRSKKPRLAGYLMLTIKLDFLEKLAKQAQVGESGQVFVTDAAGTILFHRSKSRIGEQLPADLFQELMYGIRANKPVSATLNEQTSLYQGMELHERVMVFAVYPEKELFTKSLSLGRSVLLITSLAILLTTGFLLGILKNLLLKPIHKLSVAAREMGRGQVLVPIDVKSNDEIGELAQTFKEMGENLKHYHEQVNYVACHDSLTGLPNRLMFKDYLGRATSEAQRNLQRLAVLFLDLDNFKRINDTMGHQVGDKLLEAFADRVLDQLRDTDVMSRSSSESASCMMARLAGDEFIILLPRTTGPTEAQKVARRILESLGEPFIIAKQEMYVSSSIGIAMFPDDGENADDLLKNADIAMYHAKKLGRNNYQYYSSKLNEESLYKLKIESRLRTAIENDNLRLFYQPQVDMASGSISGVEALLRWDDPEMGPISPEIFIPIAEEYGLIVPISEWVITESCRQAREWIDTYPTPLNMSINISAVHFNSVQLDTTIARTLEATGLDPQYLELELTETSILQDPEQAIKTLTTFKDMGLQTSLDDFGTGYSSLSYLMKLPLDKLKIDQSFITNLEKDSKSTAIVSAIIGMAHSLGLSVIAEGVETELHVQLLRAMQCDTIQGYFIARPIPAEDIEKMIEDRERQSA